MNVTPPYRYQAVAEMLRGLIEQGTFTPGMRVPSVREICRQQRISLSTALQAYRALEAEGLLIARPQSGYYVASSAANVLPLPARSKPPQSARLVSMSGRLAELLDYASDPDLVPFGCAIPSAELLAAQPLDRLLARVARLHGRQSNGYTGPQGDASLRAQIARRALQWGESLVPDAITITCGCSEALSLALHAVTKPGDTVAIESPTYFGMLQTLQAQGLKAFELPTDFTDGIDLNQLDRALSKGKIQACLLASSFNNPLGCTMSEDKKRVLLSLLARHQVPLIEDDIYGDIHFDRERPKPFSALSDYDRVIYCSSFSKTLAPGYRVGWLVGRRYGQRILELKLASTLCGPALPQLALAHFLEGGGYERHLRRLRRQLAENVSRMTGAINQAFPLATQVTRPRGGFVLWLVLPEAIATEGLLKQALAERISFVPGSFFSASGNYSNCLRLSCGHHWDARIEAAIHRLGALTHAAMRRSGV